ncbi:MAG: long-chain fatty acid--CoA ligase [Bacteroidales bacterium]|nr:long-chain fatty acid--CoA ligase [Bacteroidales bacterium]
MSQFHFSTMVFDKAKKYAKHQILFYRDELTSAWRGITWGEMADCVMSTAKALVEVGVAEHDCVGICSQNMIECLMADFANYANRAVSVPLYATLSPEQIKYCVNDSQMKLLFVGEQLQFDNVLEVIDQLPSLVQIVVFEPKTDLKGCKKAVYFTDFLHQGQTEQNEEIVCLRQKAATLDDLAIVMYTSGTTGNPKGTMLLHSALHECMHIHDMRIKMPKNNTSLAFLPLSHIFERGWTYFCMYKNTKVYLNRRPSEITKILKEVKPNMMCNVPRFWEKVAIGVKEKIETFSPFMKGVVTWSIDVGKRYNIDVIRVGKHASPLLWFRYLIANNLVFRKLRKAIGIENGILFPVAGAAMDEKLIAFFRCLGIPMMYGYGLSETCASVCCYPYKNYTFGSIGDLMPNVQVRIGDDNEIQVKAKTVTVGYYNKPEETAAAFTEDGWFRTGDAGRLEGKTLFFVDRIKDLFKTSNGKYISPQLIETKLGGDKYIEQVAVIGNNRNFVTAIIAPALEPLKTFAQEHGITYQRIEELLAHPKIIQLIAERIEENQKEFASFEKIKRFRLIKKGFSIESGELTSTLKIRRAVIQQNYAALINEMYADVEMPIAR